MPRTRNAKTQSAASKSARSGAKAQPPSIRGEKRVKRTEKTVPVGPAKRRRGTHDGPTDPVAVDRRKQITGTDEPASDKSARARKGGGNAGRSAVGLPGRV